MLKRVNLYDPKNNDDYVSAFEKGGDREDVTSTAKTIMSIIWNTDFDKLSENTMLESIDNVPDSNVIILDSDIFEPIIENNDFTSNRYD